MVEVLVELLVNVLVELMSENVAVALPGTAIVKVIEFTVVAICG
jgi:hypothetical protein